MTRIIKTTTKVAAYDVFLIVKGLKHEKISGQNCKLHCDAQNVVCLFMLR